MIHSQLACQNMAIQKYTNLVKVPSRFKNYRYTELYQLAHALYPKRGYVQDYEYFDECQDLQYINCKDELMDYCDVYRFMRMRERSGVKTMFNVHPVRLTGTPTKETIVKW
jgi:hypothetical protein